MNIIRLFCDKCKREINEDDKHFRMTVEGGPERQYFDICKSCLQGLGLPVEIKKNFLDLKIPHKIFRTFFIN